MKGGPWKVEIDDKDVAIDHYLSTVGIRSELGGLDVLGQEVEEAHLREGLYLLEDFDRANRFHGVTVWELLYSDAPRLPSGWGS